MEKQRKCAGEDHSKATNSLRKCVHEVSDLCFPKQRAKPLTGTASLVNKIQSPDLVVSAHKFPSCCGRITLPTTATADSILSAAAMTTWESYQRSQIRSRRIAVWKCQQLGEVGSAVIRPRLFLVEVF